jgi:hypothetical protein
LWWRVIKRSVGFGVGFGARGIGQVGFVIRRRTCVGLARRVSEMDARVLVTTTSDFAGRIEGTLIKGDMFVDSGKCAGAIASALLQD